MSNINKIEYGIVPKSSFKVIRKCANCNCKTIFENSDCFRVNANGNKIDVWLIYSCKRCKHSFKLSIYERINPKQIPAKEYQKLLNNDKDLARAYGCKKDFFASNKAEIAWDEVSYSFVHKDGNVLTEEKLLEQGNQIYVYNVYKLNIRADKIAAEILGLSRSQLGKLQKSENITLIRAQGNIIIDIN
jgi:hypothetical protein